MYILQIAGSISPKLGGPTHAILGLRHEMIQRGHIVDTRTTTAYCDDVEVDSLRAEGVCVLPTVGPKSIQFSPILAIRAAAILRRSPPDFVIMHGLLIGWHALFSVLCNHYKIPYAVQLHGGLEPYQQKRARLKKRLVRRLFRRTVRRAAFVACAAQSEVEGLLASEAEAHPLVTGIGTAVNSIAAPIQHSGRFAVGFIGRIAEKKRLDLVFAACQVAAQSLPVALHVAGASSESERAHVAKMAEQFGHANLEVHIYGFLGEIEKATLLRSLRAFVLPSDNENFSVAALEALAFGVPVVASSYVAVALEAASSGAALIVEQRPAAIAAALVSLRSSPSLHQTMAVAARSFVAEKYSWALVGQRWMDAITNANHPPRPEPDN